ncbi:MAG: alpha/beta fold hydrolase [Promethearchaeota archaeon]
MTESIKKCFNETNEKNTELKGFLETRRFRIPYRVYGNNPRTLVLINGVQQSMGMWRDIVPEFLDYFRVLIFDFPGQGRAEILHGPTVVSFEEQIEVLYDLVIATGSYHDLSLISASWGSIILMSFAERYPEMVNKMILGSFGTRPNPHLRNLMKEATELIDKKEFSKLSETIICGFGGNLPEKMKQGIRYQFQNINEKHLLTLREHIDFVDKIEDITKVIKPENITTKTLLVNGDKDTIIDIEDNREFVEKMPNCEWIIAKDTGHFIVFENFTLLGIFKNFLVN